MCGIAGILKVHPPGAAPPPPEVAIPESWLDILDESIKHRGPDGQGRFRDRATRPDGSIVDVALVHRRLAIIDRAGGHQPMVSSRGRNADEGLVAVVFNGCIYNHRELRKELQAAGHRFETDHSDTEVLVHGWREWGPQLIEHLDGMCAWAVWDRGAAELAVARDGFGEKPLHVLCAGEAPPLRPFAFASCVPGLVRLQRAAELPSSSWANQLPMLLGWAKYGWNQTGAIPGIEPQWTGSCRVLTADAAPLADSARGEATRIAGWWRHAIRKRDREWTDIEAEAAVRESVHSRLVSDVPVGVFLSGGLDSSLVACFAREVLPDLTAFTVRMPVAAFDESDAAAAVARHLGIRHHVLDCDARPAEDLCRLIPLLGLPFGDSSILPSSWVSRAAREHVTVALGGEGGDEMFLGYDRQRAIRVLGGMARVPRPVRLIAAGLIRSGADPRSIRTRLSRLLNASAHAGYKELTAIFSPPFDHLVGLRSDRRASADVGSELHHWGMTGGDEMTALRYDLMFYLPEDLMRKADTASMAVALELRSPMLAPRLAQEAMSATTASLMPRGQLKGLLRQVARKYLPAEIVDRPKQGFAIPIGEWFRSDYGGMKQLLMDHLNSAEPWGPPELGIDLNMAYVRKMLGEHMGTGMSGRVKRDHSQRLYMLLVLSIWAKWLGSLRN